MKKVFRKAGSTGTRGRRYTKGTNPVTKVADVLPAGATLAGPFPASTQPSHPGPYRRDYQGRQFWSYWTGRTWGMMGKNLKRAVTRKDKASSVQTGCPWYGISQKA